MAKIRPPAVAALRTSSAAHVGVDRDSERRQRAAIQAFAKQAGFGIADGDWYYDAAVSGADPIEGREGFARRSEERRVGKEWRRQTGRYRRKKKIERDTA